MIGHEIAGYSITRLLSNGGMSNIFVGVNEQRERVLVRRLRPDAIKDRHMRAAFIHGAHVLAKIDHPNVVRVLRTGESADKQPFMVLDYAEGNSMRELLSMKSELLRLNPLSMIRQMAAALCAVHSAGYLHLDFKPENLVVREDGHVVLIDFDLAHERKPKPFRLHPLPGTYAYLPPETLQRQLVDERTDVYAFGVSCYELLTRHRPFEGETLEKCRQMQIDPRFKPKSLLQHQVSVAPALERVIFKCLARVPDDRYPSMSLVQRDIETMV